MKKLLALVLSLSMVFALCACGQQAAPATPVASDAVEDEPLTPDLVEAETLTLRICLSETTTDTKAEVVREVTARITERTEGRIAFDIYYSDALGSIGEVIEQMSMGGNIVGCTSGEQWAAYGCADMTALNMMYVFPSHEAIMKFNESEVFDGMVEELAESGITMLCMNWACAPRVVLSTKPIESTADFKDLIIRVPSATFDAFFSAMGAATTSMPFGDIYTAMQSGIVEACEAPLSTLYGYSIQEVAKHMFMSEHSYASGCFGMSTDIWDLISPEDQAIIAEEFEEGGKIFAERSMESNAGWLSKMEEAGVTIVYPSDEDKAAMTKAAADSFTVFPELSEGLLERIQATFN